MVDCAVGAGRPAMRQLDACFESNHDAAAAVGRGRGTSRACVVLRHVGGVLLVRVARPLAGFLVGARVVLKQRTGAWGHHAFLGHRHLPRVLGCPVCALESLKHWVSASGADLLHKAYRATLFQLLGRGLPSCRPACTKVWHAPPPAWAPTPTRTGMYPAPPAQPIRTLLGPPSASGRCLWW